MKFKSRSLSLHNVVQLLGKIDSSRSWFDQADEIGGFFKQTLIGKGCYTSGPIVYTYNPTISDKLVIMTPIGNKVELVGEDASNFNFEETLNVDTDFYYRHYDLDEEIPYNELEALIMKTGKKIVNIYHVVLNFYGDTMIDLYYEVEGVDEN